MIRIIRAQHLGMCFGVRDAIDLAVQHAETAPLTILGDLVHNNAVLERLRAKGIVNAQDPTQVTTETVMITAHGASERRLAGARALGLQIVEATCPLVRVAHRAIAALLRDGYHPVIIGQRTHVEVRGLTEDLDDFDVVLDESDIPLLQAAGTLRCRGPDDAAGRARAAPGRADSTAISTVGGPIHRHRLPPDERAPDRGRRIWRASQTSSS